MEIKYEYTILRTRKEQVKSAYTYNFIIIRL